MFPRRPRIWLLFLPASVVSCSASQEPRGLASGAIQGGTVDDGDSAVGLLVDGALGGCTGTLVAPDVVLTAAHCIDFPPVVFYTGRGSVLGDLGNGMLAHGVAVAEAYPGYKPASLTCPNPTADVALAFLKEAVADAAPIPFGTAPPVMQQTCVAVGFGAHDDNDAGQTLFGQKRTATEVTTASFDAAIQVIAGTGIADKGDSGGPLLCGRTLVGLACCHTDGHDSKPHVTEYYARVDGAASWIAQRIAYWHNVSAPAREAGVAVAGRIEGPPPKGPAGRTWQ